MNQLRTRLLIVFLAATILPLVATGILVSSLLEESLSYSTTEELERLSESLETTGRDYYTQAREVLQKDALSGALAPQVYKHAERSVWPAAVVEFWDSGAAERFALGGVDGNRLDFMVRNKDDVALYSRTLGNVHMQELTAQIRDSRQLIGLANARDLRRGLTTVLIILVVAVWCVSFAALVYVANRMSRPIQELTQGLSQLAAGNLNTRIRTSRSDEIGSAIRAFNHSASELQQSRDKLVYLTQIASWQTLARKMAHELKNSLTPIRLTVEEIRARQPVSEHQFMEQAVRIVVSEVESLERRVSAFSEFSSEPAVRLGPLDVNALIAERISFLKPGHPATNYSLESGSGLPLAFADADRVKGILTNLLENAAEAAGAGGQIAVRLNASDRGIGIEVHDSGPGLSDEARRTLFEPTISFKARGMGLGLSIARKDALMCGGDLIVIQGRLKGAAFRLILPANKP